MKMLLLAVGGLFLYSCNPAIYRLEKDYVAYEDKHRTSEPILLKKGDQITYMFGYLQKNKRVAVLDTVRFEQYRMYGYPDSLKGRGWQYKYDGPLLSKRYYLEKGTKGVHRHIKLLHHRNRQMIGMVSESKMRQ